MRLVEWRRLRQGRLYGFATVELPIGLVIREIGVLHGPEGLWAALPGQA
jgi:DNA-binding cell septation regulator SpoVG